MRVKSTRPVDNFELRSWFFMRISGALIFLVVLVHLAYVHFIHGVSEIDYKFVVDRWSNPTWRLFALCLMVLALAHGANGARILIDDYVRSKGRRTVMLTGLYASSAFVFVLGVFGLVFTKGR